MIPKAGSKPPLYHYGIPFTDRYMLEYAKRHHLTMKLLPEARKFFGGKAEFPFADISREDEEDEVGSLHGRFRSHFSMTATIAIYLWHLFLRCTQKACYIESWASACRHKL